MPHKGQQTNRSSKKTAVEESGPLSNFINQIEHEINDPKLELDFIKISQAIINFDSSNNKLISRGTANQKQRMQLLVQKLYNFLDNSDPENTFLVIDNLRKMSIACDATLNSQKVLDFVVSRIEKSSQEELVKILHSLVQCGFNEGHYANLEVKNFQDIIANKFFASFKDVTNENLQRFYFRTVIDKFSDLIYGLSHLKNLGILDKVPPEVSLDNLLQEISKIAINHDIWLKKSTLKSLLEVRLYCRDVLGVKIDKTWFGEAKFDDPTISPIQAKIFDLVIKFLRNDDGYPIKKVDHPKRTIYEIGQGCKVEIEMPYGKINAQWIKTTDFGVRLGPLVMFCEVDGSTHFANIDGNRKSVTGATMARDKIIKAITKCEPLVFATYLQPDPIEYAIDVIKSSEFLKDIKVQMRSRDLEAPSAAESDIMKVAADAAEEFLDIVEAGSAEDSGRRPKKVAAAIEDEAAAATKPTKSKSKPKPSKIQEVVDIASILLKKPLDFLTLEYLLDELLHKDDIKFNTLYDHDISVSGYKQKIADYVADSIDPRLILLFLDYDQKLAKKTPAPVVVMKKTSSKAAKASVEKSLVDRFSHTTSAHSKNPKFDLLRRIVSHLQSNPLKPPSSEIGKKWSKKGLPAESVVKTGEDLQISDLQAYISHFDSKNYAELLTEAIRNNDLWKVRFLLIDEKLINSMTKDSYFPIHIAAINDRVDVLRLLLKIGADPCSHGLFSLNICHLIASNASMELMECLPEDAVKSMILERAVGNTTVASVAIKSGNLEMLEFLYKNGVVFDNGDLKSALDSSKLEVLEFLYSIREKINSDLVAKGKKVKPDIFDNKKQMMGYCHKAARDSNLPVLKFLCEKLGGDIHSKEISQFFEGNTLLHSAIMSDDKEVLKYVISLGFSIDSRNNKGETPLYRAVEYDQRNSVQFLIDGGADLFSAIEYVKADDPDAPAVPYFDEGFAPYKTNSIQCAVVNNNLEMLKILLANPAAKNLINRKDYLGDTILHGAAVCNQHEIVKYLVLEANMPIDVQNAVGYTPLMLAISEAKSEEFEDSKKTCCDALILAAFLSTVSSKGDQEFDRDRYMNRLSPQDQNTALSLMAKYCVNNPADTDKQINDDILRVLIENGARIDVKDSRGISVISNIIGYGITVSDEEDKKMELQRVVILLMDLSPSVTDYHQPDNYGNTLLHMAVLRNLSSVVKYLLKKGADVNAENEKGVAPIAYDASDEMYNLLRPLFSNFPSKQNKIINSIIHAIEYGNIKYANEILDRSTEKEDLYNRLFHESSKLEFTKVIKELRLRGFKLDDVFDYDGFKMTPLQRAVSSNAYESVGALLEEIEGVKANIDLATEFHPSPLLIAAQENNDKIFNLLLECGAIIDDAAIVLIAKFAAAREDKEEFSDLIWECLLEHFLEHDFIIDDATILLIAEFAAARDDEGNYSNRIWKILLEVPVVSEEIAEKYLEAHQAAAQESPQSAPEQRGGDQSAAPLKAASAEAEVPKK